MTKSFDTLDLWTKPIEKISYKIRIPNTSIEELKIHNIVKGYCLDNNGWSFTQYKECEYFLLKLNNKRDYSKHFNYIEKYEKDSSGFKKSAITNQTIIEFLSNCKTIYSIHLFGGTDKKGNSIDTIIRVPYNELEINDQFENNNQQILCDDGMLRILISK